MNKGKHKWHRFSPMVLGVWLLAGCRSPGTQNVAPSSPSSAIAPDTQNMVMTGEADPTFQAFDTAILDYMRRGNIPGGALAVVKEGHLIYARGYGYADVKTKTPVQPTSLFRLGSISKPFTSAAILTLAQNPHTHLNLDAPAFALLGLKPYLKPGTHVDPRLWKVTVRQLLHHTGGFDRAVSFDPLFDTDDHPEEDIANALGVASPPSPQAVIRYMMGRPLDFDPGTRYAYSNLGYSVLGRVIEKVSGQPYETYVRQNVLSPIGITRMRLGKTRRKDRAPGEVCYYQADEKSVGSVFPEDGDKQVPWPYGGFYLEGLDSCGGWIASAVDVARFAAQLDFPDNRHPLLTPKSLQIMNADPVPTNGYEGDGDQSYACGWEVRSSAIPGKPDYYHAGYLDGTDTLVMRRHDGITWVVLFNQASMQDPSDNPALHRAADAIRDWPKRDLFPRYLADPH